MKKISVLIVASLALGGCMATVTPARPPQGTYVVWTRPAVRHAPHFVHHARPKAPVRMLARRVPPRAKGRPVGHPSPAARIGHSMRIW